MISLRDTPSDRLRAGSQTPGKGLCPSLHSPYFSSPTAKLRRMLGEDVAFDNLDC